MWTLILILYIGGGTVSTTEVPEPFATKSACMNRGTREKANMEAHDDAVTVRYRCFKAT